MIAAWRPEQVYAAERALPDELASGELMQRAARGLADVILARAEQRGARRLVALVGSGNNGADAMYAVAHCAATGLACAVVTTADSVHEEALAAARAAGVMVSLGQQAPVDAAEVVAEADIVIDGLVGLGGRPGLRETALAAVQAIPDEAYVIAVDVPSGHDVEGAALSPDGVFADETVTFSVAKPVHILPPGEQACGVLTVVDIGLSMEPTPAVQRLTHADAAALWPVPVPGDDKYSRGVVGVVAGSETYPGAAVLSVLGAVEAGAGMVRYVGPEAVAALVLSAAPEVVVGTGRVQAWVVGPGRSGEGGDEMGPARQALAEPVAVLIDAGGLELIDDAVIAARRGLPTLLTPHAGEAARLLSKLGGRPITRAQVEAEPLRSARRLAELTGMTVLVKGATTIVVSPDPADPVRSQADAPPWLATAGSGDVLAGLVGTLLAAGLSPLDAGALGALVHGVAGDLASSGGPLRALRLAHGIPHAVSGLLTRA